MTCDDISLIAFMRACVSLYLSFLEQIIVDFDGSVWRGWCRVGGSFGNIKDPQNVNFPKLPVHCNKSYCHCNFDIMCKKVLPEHKYEVLPDADD